VDSLDIRDCTGIDALEGMEELCRRCEKLDDLRLRSPKINDSSIRSISKYCKNLTVLDLQECVSVSKEGLYSLLDGCPSLQQMNLIGVDYATPKFRSDMLQRKPSLLKLLINPYQ
jgi:hypothetical protein